MNLINDIDYVFGNRTNTIKMIEQCNWHSFLSTAPNERDQVWFLFGSRCPKSLIFSGYIQFFPSHIFSLYLPICASSLSSSIFIFFSLSLPLPTSPQSPSLSFFLPLLSPYLSLCIISPSPPLFLSLPLYFLSFSTSLSISTSVFSLNNLSPSLFFLFPLYFSLSLSLNPSFPLSLSLTLFCISSFTLSSYSSCLLYLSPLSLSIPPSLFYRYPRCL